MDFRDFPTAGGLYTWSGVRGRGRLWRKLVRVQCNTSWIVQFPSIFVELLSRVTSDHNPLVISYEAMCEILKFYRKC